MPLPKQHILLNIFKIKNQFIRNKATQTCLAIYEANNKVVITVNCDLDNEHLYWKFTDPMIIEKSEKNDLFVEVNF